MTSRENHLSYTTQSEGHFGDQCILFQHLWIHIKLNKTTNWVINVSQKPWSMETLRTLRFFFLMVSHSFFFFCPSFQSGQQKRENFTWMCFHRFLFFKDIFVEPMKKLFLSVPHRKKKFHWLPHKNFFSLVPHIIIFFMCETNEKTFLMRSDFFFCKWIYFFPEFLFTTFFFTFGFSRHFCSTQKSYIFSWRGKIFHLVLHRNLQTNFTQLDEVNFFRIFFFFFYILFLSFFRVLSRFFHPKKIL